MGGKVLIPTQQHVRTLAAARLAADVLGVPTIIVARTDSLGATLITSDVDERDREFIDGERTSEGFFHTRACIESPIKRALAYAPYADLIWCETSTPDLDEARRFAEAVHAEFPGKMLAYNCSPSFNWRKYLDDATIATFQKELGAMGYAFQFITLAGWHALNYSMFELAKAYTASDMTGYVALQTREFDSEGDGYTATRHQREVGAGYFDDVATVISGGKASTLALKGGWPTLLTATGSSRARSAALWNYQLRFLGSTHLYVEAFAPAQGCERGPLGRRRLLDRREPVEERVEGDLRLEASQVGAEAKVHAVAERQMPIVATIDVEAQRIGEPQRIVVRGSEVQHDQLIGLDRDAGDLGGLTSDARREQDRRIATQHLLDRSRHASTIRTQCVDLDRVLEQSIEAVAEQVLRGLVASEDQLDHHGLQLECTQAVAIFLGRDEPREKVAGRASAALGDHRTDVLVEAAHRRVAGVACVLGGHTRGDRQRIRPLAHEIDVDLRDADHLADHPQRQDACPVVHELDVTTVRRDLVAQLVRDARRNHAHVADRSRCERSSDQPAQPRVIGRVHHHDVAIDPVDELARGPTLHAEVARTHRGEVRIVETGETVLVAEERHRLEARDERGDRSCRMHGCRRVAGIAPPGVGREVDDGQR